MKKALKVFCFLNGPYLGGAERSFILQAKDLKSKSPDIQLSFYIPFFKTPDDGKKIKSFLEENGFNSWTQFYYRYSSWLYQLSRKGGWTWPFQAVIGLLSTLRTLGHLQLSSPDVWWVGGNKVGFVVFLLGHFMSFKGRLLWHFRDYPYRRGIFSLIWKMFKMPHSLKLEAIGNSHDVSRSIAKGKAFKKVHTLYNPVGKMRFSPREKGPYKLGTAAMFSPWKGIHSLVLFALIHEKELRSMGFEKFHIYGDEIYQTKGNHQGYKKALQVLQKKFKSQFISFEGLRDPSEIFSELDVFIHGSLEPEPYGRVLLESYKTGTFLISTGLGGAKELIDNFETGRVFIPHHNKELLRCIQDAISDSRLPIIQKAKFKADDIETEYLKQLSQIFEV